MKRFLFPLVFFIFLSSTNGPTYAMDCDEIAEEDQQYHSRHTSSSGSQEPAEENKVTLPTQKLGKKAFTRAILALIQGDTEPLGLFVQTFKQRALSWIGFN